MELRRSTQMREVGIGDTNIESRDVYAFTPKKKTERDW